MSENEREPDLSSKSRRVHPLELCNGGIGDFVR